MTKIYSMKSAVCCQGEIAINTLLHSTYFNIHAMVSSRIGLTVEDFDMLRYI